MSFIRVALLLVLLAPDCRAETPRLHWPIQPATVIRAFDAPMPDWRAGHRGVDLGGVPGQPVYSAGSGTVVFAGLLAGRPVISIDHPGGLRTSYEPVQAVVRAGQPVDPTTPVGRLAAGHPGCPAPACLHWGAYWGPAQRALYIDPVGLLAETPVRLKPLN